MGPCSLLQKYLFFSPCNLEYRVFKLLGFLGGEFTNFDPAIVFAVQPAIMFLYCI